MSASAYERVSGNAEEDFGYDDNHTFPHRLRTEHSGLPVIRPAVYYEEGPFDPPSSDDEGEDLIEKRYKASGSNELDDTEPGNRLQLGGSKVSDSFPPLTFRSRLYRRGQPV